MEIIDIVVLKIRKSSSVNMFLKGSNLEFRKSTRYKKNKNKLKPFGKEVVPNRESGLLCRPVPQPGSKGLMSQAHVSIAVHKWKFVPELSHLLIWGNYNPNRDFGRFGRIPKFVWELRSISNIVY